MWRAAVLPRLWHQAGLSTFLPHYVAAAMFGLFEKGSWGLSAGTSVHGWPLVALWVIEAGLILCVATRVAVNQIATVPFCENCQEWIAGRTPPFYVGGG